MQAFVPCAAALLSLISVYLLSTKLTRPKLKNQPLPLEDLLPRSLRELHDDLLRGSIEMELPVEKEAEISWSLPARWQIALLWERFIKKIKKKKKTNKCLFCPYTYQHPVKANIFLFLASQDALEVMGVTD